MNRARKIIPVIVLLVFAVVAASFSPICLWSPKSLPPVLSDMYDISKQIKDGILAYVEVDGSYGPVIYELFGLGYLLTDGHEVHAIIEMLLIFGSLHYLYLAARNYCSELMSVIAAGVIVLLNAKTLTSVGPEEVLFLIFACAAYHVSSQCKQGYKGHHTYLLAVDMGLIFFAQPSYLFIIAGILLFFAIYFPATGLEGKQYMRFWASILEGIITVAVPMCLYLLYFKNFNEFMQQVVVTNFSSMGSLGSGLASVLATPWVIMLLVYIILGAILFIMQNCMGEYFCWLIFSVLAIVVIALTDASGDARRLLSMVVYIIPIALLGMLLDKLLHINQPKEEEQLPIAEEDSEEELRDNIY